MRIALFTDVYLEIPGGIPSSIKAQKAALEALGHQVTIFCPGWNDNLQDKSVIVVPTHRHLQFNRVPLAKRPEKILRFIKRRYPAFADTFNLVHVHYEASCSIAGVKLAKKNHIKLVQTMHGREDIAIDTNLPSPTKYFVAFALNFLHQASLSSIHPSRHVNLPKQDRLLIKNTVCRNMWEIMVRQANLADVVVSPTHHFAKNLEYYGVKQIHIVSNGVDDRQLQKYSFKPRSFDSKNILRIIWSSRLSKEKRILPFLESLAKTKNKKHIKLTIIGDGNQLQEARNYAKKHFSNRQVVFLGLVPHEKIFEHMQKQHISVINSYGFDTQGMTILEAVACGLPVLYADPAMDEVVPKDGGLRAKDASTSAMADQIDYLFDHPELIQKMSEQVFTVQKSVLESTQVKHLLELYES